MTVTAYDPMSLTAISRRKQTGISYMLLPNQPFLTTQTVVWCNLSRTQHYAAQLHANCTHTSMQHQHPSSVNYHQSLVNRHTKHIANLDAFYLVKFSPAPSAMLSAGGLSPSGLIKYIRLFRMTTLVNTQVRFGHAPPLHCNDTLVHVIRT